MDLTKTIRIAPTRTRLGTEIIDLSKVRGELETKLLDLGQAAALQAELRELCVGASVPDASASAPEAASARAPAPAPAGPVGDTTIVLRQNTGAGELERTIYDGGALRDFARGLAEEQSKAEAPPLAGNGACVVHGGARLRALVSERWRAVWAHFRTARPSRKLLLALLPLALVASALGTSATLLRQRATERSPGPASTGRAAARRTTPAERAAHPPTRAPAPMPPASVLGAGSLAKPGDAGVAHAPAAAPAPAPDPALERVALRAAFDGNKREAVAAYERLGERPGGEPFKLAARLLREDHVRKP